MNLLRVIRGNLCTLDYVWGRKVNGVFWEEDSKRNNSHVKSGLFKSVNNGKHLKHAFLRPVFKWDVYRWYDTGQIFWKFLLELFSSRAGLEPHKKAVTTLMVIKAVDQCGHREGSRQTDRKPSPWVTLSSESLGGFILKSISWKRDWTLKVLTLSEISQTQEGTYWVIHLGEVPE